MHLPSELKLWQIPPAEVFPIPVPSPIRSTPLEEQDTSYLAASERMVSFSISVMFPDESVTADIPIVGVC